ncbi:MAG: hypothetical protein KAG66_20420, partial [Methylococcales bacterium]|nr:hypothetical protein [Methylococcales bacterium]
MRRMNESRRIKKQVAGSGWQMLRTTGYILLAICYLLLATPSASAQDGGNWLQAVANNQLTVTSMSGGTPFLTHPILNVALENQLETGYSVFPVLGDMFKSSGGNYCTMVLAGNGEPIVVPPAGEAITVALVGYCLELP